MLYDEGLKEKLVSAQPIYLDYNASTPHDPAVIDAMRPYLEEHFGNPSSASTYGQTNRKAVERAREQVAALLGCQPDEVVFTSGGTESNNHALKGVAWAQQEWGNHLITSQIEHPAVLEVCRLLEKHGFEVTYLPVDRFGLVSAKQLEHAITPKTVLISIMQANNEVGTIQPVEQIARIARRHEVLLHSDAAQSAGKIPVNVNALGVDLLSLAGHKVYAPKGVGALYVRRGVRLENLMQGAGHEGGRRPGTENVLEIVGLGAACEVAHRNLEAHRAHMQTLRDLLHLELEKHATLTLNGHPELRLPNTLSVSFEGVDAHALLARLQDKLAASTGAACHADKVHVSHVLQAMGVDEKRALGTVRFSVGRMTTRQEVETAAHLIADEIARAST